MIHRKKNIKTKLKTPLLLTQFFSIYTLLYFRTQKHCLNFGHVFFRIMFLQESYLCISARIPRKNKTSYPFHLRKLVLSRDLNLTLLAFTNSHEAFFFLLSYGIICALICSSTNIHNVASFKVRVNRHFLDKPTHAPSLIISSITIKRGCCRTLLCCRIFYKKTNFYIKTFEIFCLYLVPMYVRDVRLRRVWTRS